MFKRFFRSDSKLIDNAFAEVEQMLRQSAEMYDHALAVLLDNEQLRVDLEDLDDAVDESERSVRRRVLEHLSLNPSHDLVASLVLVSIVQDAERIGDFARGLVELVPLARRPRGGDYVERLRRLAGTIRPLFDLTIETLGQDDAEKARQVMAEAKDAKRKAIAFTADVAASDLSPDMAVVYSSAARILRRIGAHLSNICSSVAQPYDRIRHDDEDV